MWIIHYSKTSRKTLKNIGSIWWRKKIHTICICEKNYVIFFLVEHFWSSAESWSSVPIILGRFLQNEPVSYAIIAEASTPIFIFLIRSSTSAWPQQLYSWLPTSTMMNSSTTNFKTHRLWLPTWILFRIYNEEIIYILQIEICSISFLVQS